MSVMTKSIFISLLSRISNLDSLQKKEKASIISSKWDGLIPIGNSILKRNSIHGGVYSMAIGKEI